MRAETGTVGRLALATAPPAFSELLGRIDITLKFLRQFGSEDDYVGVECKRVSAGSAFSQLNSRYVAQGVARFINGQYATGHAWGFMLGYALARPPRDRVSAVTTISPSPSPSATATTR